MSTMDEDRGNENNSHDKERAQRVDNRQSSARTKYIYLWVTATIIAIVAVLSVVVHIVFRQQNDGYQKPGETITIPVEDIFSGEAAVDASQDTYRVMYDLQKEVTAHVLEYIITVYRNGKLHSTINHSSAPIESISIEDRSGTIILTVVDADQIDDTTYRSSYSYELYDDGLYSRP